MKYEDWVINGIIDNLEFKKVVKEAIDDGHIDYIKPSVLNSLKIKTNS